MRILSLTVLIPAYNREGEIGLTLKSILNQMEFYPKYVFVLDDCSSDNTVLVCENLYNDFKCNGIELCIFKSTQNMGPSFQRNKGWDEAKTEYIALLDSDDIWKSNFLRHFNDDIKNKDIKFWACNFKNSHISKKRKNYYVPYLSQLLSNKATCSSSIIKRELAERFEIGMRHSEDFRLFTELTYKYGLFFNVSELVELGRGLNTTGGLSGNIYRMRVGEMITYFSIYKYNKYGIPLIPVLILFSILKHVRLILRRYLNVR